LWRARARRGGPAARAPPISTSICRGLRDDGSMVGSRRTIALSRAAAAGAMGRRAQGNPPMASAVQDLLAVLDLEPLEVNLFRGRSPQVGWQRVYGGQGIRHAPVRA